MRQFVGTKLFKTCGVDGGRHGKRFKAAQFIGRVVAAWLGSGHQRFRRVINAVGQVQRKTLSRQGVAAAAVDSASLRIHHVVVLQKAFAAPEVVLFDLLLGALNALGHHGVLDHVALLMPHAVHQAGNAFRAKKAHQVVFKRDKKLRRSRISLTPRASAQLAVHAARVMALCANNGQSAGFFGLWSQFNVGTATGHVGGDGHGFGPSGLGHNVGLLLVQLGVEYLVRNLANVQGSAQ